MTEKAKKILRPLYFYAFIEALVFWYAIEKLLWSSSGITAEQIIILGIIAQCGQIVVEVPSSIIADRWSRRKTLIASSGFMLLAIAIALAVQSFLSFLIMSLVWAFYYAFQSGTINAYVYDLLKEQNQQSQYRKAMSRFGTLQLSGLLVSSFAASVIVHFGDFLTPYWITIFPTIGAILLLLKMRDPPLERTEDSTGNLFRHVKSSIKNVTAKRWLILIFIALAFVTAGRFIWYEYYQLFALERDIAAGLFGLLLALIHIGNILGSEFAHRVKEPKRILITAFSAAVLCTFFLAFASTPAAIIFLLIICFFGSQAASLVLDESLQHETKSELRATTLSLAGLLSRIFFGVGALAIIMFSTTAAAISFVALFLLLCSIVYLPVRKYLTRPV